jgi:branched-chain amino acid transport system substrate-binding protein
MSEVVMRMWSKVLFAVAATLFMGLAGCSSSGSSAKTSAIRASNTAGGASTGSSPCSKPYQIGFDADLSGIYAALGTGERDGFGAYFKYANAHGGINGCQVTITNTDDAADITRGTANVTQLITQNNVIGIGGGLTSNICGAQVPIATSRQVPMLCSAVSDDLLSPVHPYLFSARLAQFNESLPMITFAQQLKPNPKIAVIAYATASAVELESDLVKFASQKGLTVTTNQGVPLNTSDISAQVAKIIASAPDVIVGALTDPLALTLMRNLAAKGLNIPFLDYDGATLSGSLSVLKDPNLYALSSMTMDGQGTGAGLKQYRDAAALAGVDITKSFVNVGYAEGIELGASLQACGQSCTGPDLQKAMDKLNYDTGGFVSGNVVFTPLNHEATNKVSFYHWDVASGKLVAAVSNLPAGAPQ